MCEPRLLKLKLMLCRAPAEFSLAQRSLTRLSATQSSTAQQAKQSRFREARSSLGRAFRFEFLRRTCRRRLWSVPRGTLMATTRRCCQHGYKQHRARMGALATPRSATSSLQAQRPLQRCGACSQQVTRNMKQRLAAIDAAFSGSGGGNNCARRSAFLRCARASLV
jgi:hypothetical protein